MADVFISYARPDAPYAEQLTRELDRRGVSVFIDRDTLVAGTDYQEEIARTLGRVKVVLVLLSENTRRSSWVQEELASVLERAGGPVVVPVLLDGHAKENWVWPLVSDRNAIDLTVGEMPIAAVADQVARLVAPEELPRVSHRRGYLVAAMLLACMAIAAVSFWWLSPAGTGQTGKVSWGLQTWLPLLTGALGVLVGYLLNMARK